MSMWRSDAPTNLNQTQQGGQSRPTVTGTFQTQPVSAKPSQIVTQNINRIEFVVQNIGTYTVYLGTDESVTTQNGIPLFPYFTYRSRQTEKLYAVIPDFGQGNNGLVSIASETLSA